MTTPYKVPMPQVLPFAWPIAGLPAAAPYKGQSVWVTDLHGGIGGYCQSDGIAWIPRGRDATLTRNITAGGTLTLTPLVDRPIQILKGTVPALATLAIGFSTANAWNGCRFRLVNRLTILGQVKILTSLFGAAWSDFICDDTGTFVNIGTAGLL